MQDFVYALKGSQLCWRTSTLSSNIQLGIFPIVNLKISHDHNTLFITFDFCFTNLHNCGVAWRRGRSSGIDFHFFNETPTLHFVLKKSSCNQGQLVTFQSHFRYFRYSWDWYNKSWDIDLQILQRHQAQNQSSNKKR